MRKSSSQKLPITVLVSGVGIGIVLSTVVSAAFPGSSIFSDVPAGHFADDAIGRMHELGVIKGRDASHFDPKGSLTRAEAAVLMDRLYAVMNGSVASKSSSSVASSEWHVASSVPKVSSSSSSSSSSETPVSSLFALSATEYGVMENGGGVAVTIIRSGDTGQASNVSYYTTNDTSSTGDYGAAGGTLTFAAGETTKTFTVTAKDNSSIEGSRKVNIILSSPSLGGAISTPGTAKLIIYDDETVELTDTSVFRFISAETSGSQSNGHAYVIITRTGSVGPASVSYATQNLTAIADGDYNAATGTVQFAIGETAKAVPIKLPTLSTAIGKTFQVQLSNPVSGSLTDLNLTTVTIN